MLFVLHGYGQSAQFFLRKFDAIASAALVVVAPEGLHRYYLQGTHGRVGASWMTKEDREHDIEDYIAYLNALHAQLTKERTDLQVEVLGFSQGGATAVRWASKSTFEIHRLLLWAGSFPPDVDLGSASQKLLDQHLTIILGNQDPFIQSSDIAQASALLEKARIPFEMRTFEGGHEIHQATLASLF